MILLSLYLSLFGGSWGLHLSHLYEIAGTCVFLAAKSSEW